MNVRYMFRFMPAGHPPISAHPAKPFRTLADAARDGQLIFIRCNLCHRSAYFLAADLVTFLNPRHPLHLPPFPCSKCKTAEFLNMNTHQPRAGDYGRLPVRKLQNMMQVRKWRNVKLGE